MTTVTAQSGPSSAHPRRKEFRDYDPPLALVLLLLFLAVCEPGGSQLQAIAFVTMSLFGSLGALEFVVRWAWAAYVGYRDPARRMGKLMAATGAAALFLLPIVVMKMLAHTA